MYPANGYFGSNNANLRESESHPLRHCLSTKSLLTAFQGIAAVTAIGLAPLGAPSVFGYAIEKTKVNWPRGWDSALRDHDSHFYEKRTILPTRFCSFKILVLERWSTLVRQRLSGGDDWITLTDACVPSARREGYERMVR